MHSIIQRIATGPELSKDLSSEEARLGIKAVLEGKVSSVQGGIFLIALRMKRETDEENLGILDGVRDLTQTVIAPVDDVVDIGEPYSGYNRMLPASSFLPAVLAACGVPAINHGLEKVSPKFGVTHRQILRSAGIPVDLSVEQAAARLGDAETGWAYVDQSQFCPALHKQVEFRTEMVKRSVITTVEVLTGPIRGHKATHLVTGYVHKPYPRIYAMLARHAGFDSALLVRGVEGGVMPSLRQAGKCFYYHDKGIETDWDVEPAQLGIQSEVRAPQIPDDLPMQTTKSETSPVIEPEALAKACADAGLAALKGAPGPTRDGLIYAGALCLCQRKRFDNLLDAANQIRRVLDDGSALARFK